MARNWLDPVEIERDARVFAAFVLFLCGVAAWNVISTFGFDLSIITRKRKWRSPMALYFVCRICLLLHIFSMAFNLNAISEIPCQEVTWISKISDAIGTCGSSLILILRTRAIWERDIKVTLLLSTLFFGQIVFWIQTFPYSRTKWDSQRNVCAIISATPKPVLVSVFAYTMTLDLVSLMLSAYKLSTVRRSSTLAHALWRDGIGYFCAAFGANFVQTIMAGLGSNPVINIIALPFALVVSVIAATTVFRNVFIAHDSFSGTHGSRRPGSSGGPTRPLSGLTINRLSLSRQSRILASHGVTNDVPLDAHKSARDSLGAMSVHQIVEVSVGDETRVDS